MKTRRHSQSGAALVSRSVLAGALALAFTLSLGAARADETCSSPYLARIEGQEEFVYVWTLGVEGLGDGADKLVTVDVKPGSPTYGKVINSVSVGGRNEAHHGGFTDDRRQLWLAGLENSKMFIFDVHTDPAKPKLMKTIDNFAETTGGAAGPHGAYALPGRVLIPCLSNAKDKGGRTALVEYGNDGNYIATHWLPTKDDARGAANAQFADGYGYDARVLPRKNALLTSSFTGWNNYMRDFGKLTADPEAMKTFRFNHGDVGFPCASAEKGFPSAGRAARNPLGLGRQAQLRVHRDRADLEALARLRGRQRRVAGEGGRADRRREGRRPAGRHQPERR